MKKYLAILNTENTGEWTNDPLTHAFVFEAKDDAAAVNIITSYRDNEGYFEKKIELLGCIVGGLKIRKVPKTVRRTKKVKISGQRKEEINFEELSLLDASIISQLQPFDIREKKLRQKEIERQEKEERRIAAIPLPKVGDDIYVPSVCYMTHGCDDVTGGLARVISVSESMLFGKKSHTIRVQEIPNSFFWETDLALNQNKLKKICGKDRAHPSPDSRPEFNQFD